MPLSVGGSGYHLTHGSLGPRFHTSNGLLIGSAVLAQLTVVKSGGMILSVTLRSLYALVSHLCLTGLPEVAMPYSDMWQDCQITFPHTRPCYAKSSYRSVDPSDPSWKRPPGRPRTICTDELRRDNNNVPAATLWRQAIGSGHSRATLRSEPTTR